MIIDTNLSLLLRPSRHLATEKIPFLLWNKIFDYRVHNCPTLKSTTTDTATTTVAITTAATTKIITTKTTTKTITTKTTTTTNCNKNN